MNKIDMMNEINGHPDTQEAFARLRTIIRVFASAIQKDDALALLAVRLAPPERDLRGALMWLGTRINDETAQLQHALAELEGEYAQTIESQKYLVKACTHMLFNEQPAERLRLHGEVKNGAATVTKRRDAITAQGVSRENTEQLVPDFDSDAAQTRLSELDAEEEAINLFLKDRRPFRLSERVHELAKVFKDRDEAEENAKRKKKAAPEPQTLEDRLQRLEKIAA